MIKNDGDLDVYDLIITEKGNLGLDLASFPKTLAAKQSFSHKIPLFLGSSPKGEISCSWKVKGSLRRGLYNQSLILSA